VKIELRPATRDDVGAIHRVAERAWYEAHAPIVGTAAVEAFLAEYYDAESFHTRIDAEATILTMAVDGDCDVVGFTSARPSGDRAWTFDLERIYVHPASWGEGVGRRLLDHVERTVRDRGGERIELGVMAENDRAVGFYEAAGYTRADEVYDEFVDTTSYVYEKAL
jgi:ribosomal protein S18 acetylase RimI-like enzyme